MSEKVRIKIQNEEEDLPEGGSGSGNQTPEDEEAPDEQQQSADQVDQTELTEKLKAAQDQAQDYYDRLLRVSAELENYKKRTAREMRDVVKYANEKLIKELLVVVDNLERAIASGQQSHNSEDSLLQGVNLTLGEILKVLERQNVVPIQSLGQPFDPTYHQAMMQEEVNDQPANTVVRELQKGYMIHDRLLRPALVAVSKAGGPSAGQGESRSE